MWIDKAEVDGIFCEQTIIFIIKNENYFLYPTVGWLGLAQKVCYSKQWCTQINKKNLF